MTWVSKQKEYNFLREKVKLQSNSQQQPLHQKEKKKYACYSRKESASLGILSSKTDFQV